MFFYLLVFTPMKKHQLGCETCQTIRKQYNFINLIYLLPFAVTSYRCVPAKWVSASRTTVIVRIEIDISYLNASLRGTSCSGWE